MKRLSYIEDARCLKVKERRGYSHLKEEALDRTVWRAALVEALDRS